MRRTKDLWMDIEQEQEEYHHRILMEQAEWQLYCQAEEDLTRIQFEEQEAFLN